MQFYVTIQTSEGRQINHIQANTLTQAIIQVANYNVKHPSWDMRLCDCMPASDKVLMPTILIKD